MFRLFFIMMAMSINAHAKTEQQITTGDIEISVIGDSNQSQLAIGLPQKDKTEKNSVHCKSIRKLIIGENSSVQLLLPDHLSKDCKETH